MGELTWKCDANSSFSNTKRALIVLSHMRHFPVGLTEIQWLRVHKPCLFSSFTMSSLVFRSGFNK